MYLVHTVACNLGWPPSLKRNGQTWGNFYAYCLDVDYSFFRVHGHNVHNIMCISCPDNVSYSNKEIHDLIYIYAVTHYCSQCEWFYTKNCMLRVACSEVWNLLSLIIVCLYRSLAKKGAVRITLGSNRWMGWHLSFQYCVLLSAQSGATSAWHRGLSTLKLVKTTVQQCNLHFVVCINQSHQN